MPESEASKERIFLFTEGDSRKFWRVRVEGSIQMVRYGRIGTEGHELTKTLEGPVAASKVTQKLIAEKLGKGYREVSTAEADAAYKSARSSDGDTRVAPSVLRKPRRSGKGVSLGGQQLMMAFGDEESESRPEPPVPGLPGSLPTLALEF